MSRFAQHRPAPAGSSCSTCDVMWCCASVCFAPQIFGWNVEGLITFDDATCHANKATSEGGCFYAAGGGLTTTSTTMRDNEALTGGCISKISIDNDNTL